MENSETHTITTTEGLYDLSMLEEMDDTGYLLEVLTLVLQDTPKDIKEMKEALQSGKIDTVCKKAHKLKSSAGVIQAEKLTTLLSSIELTGKNGGSVTVLTELLKDTIEEYCLIEMGLKIYIESL
ncbi:Hpt domain-containing protein [Ferruginibacter sp. SUN106]|uniref:Hpt domain-containing protein n=1 Tax=Ferruginibacter sp. SUN106 TaxID=2978348 RepID=UPI003D35A1F2